MAFESLSDKLQNVFKNLKGKGKLTPDDVKVAMKEVKMALLEADVNFRVVKQFVKSVEERAVGEEVLNGLNPGQMVIKIVNEEMTSLMGSEVTELQLQPGQAITVIMMCGLQGAGKTTTTAKIAGKLKLKGKKPLLVACDVYRPAAVEQLKINGQKQQVDVFDMGTDHSPVEIAQKGLDVAVVADVAAALSGDAQLLAAEGIVLDEQHASPPLRRSQRRHHARGASADDGGVNPPRAHRRHNRPRWSPGA